MKTVLPITVLPIAVLFCVCPVAALPTAAQELPQLSLATDQTTVSGLSSGAFMTVQLQTAFSANIAGAGVVAGGPYGCADQGLMASFFNGKVFNALYVCMAQTWGTPSAEASVGTMDSLQAEIDPVSGIATDRVYLFHGTADKTVGRPAMDALKEAYDLLGVPAENINYVSDIDAGHAFITEAGSVPCAQTEPDYLNDCDIDQAGQILTWLYGPLAPAGEPVPENLRPFAQAAYTEAAPGMGETGFVYVPQTCADGAPCRLHIALHGCEQGAGVIGETYARLTEYNRWAEANGIVVLYPQAKVIPAPWFNPYGGNPKGCWDWWGYSGSDFLSKDAPQIAAIGRMAAALGAPIAGPADGN